MVLKLNPEREPYKEFYGKNVEQMPLLIKDGRVPMNVPQLMQRRLDVRNSDADVITAFHDNYFDTGDAVAYHPDGRVKIVLDSQILREMTPESPRSGGALVLADGVYETLPGEEFKKGKLGKVNDGLSRKDVKAHAVWKALARDQGLLDDYVDWAFGEYRDRFAKGSDIDDVRIMGVYPDSAGDAPKLRAWCVYRLGGWSSVGGRGDLDDANGRFLGIVPEALSAPGKGVSNIQKYTMVDLQAFDSAVKGLEATVRPELLEPLAQLRKKL